ncbi:MAG: hypothetical protein GF309_13460 [Candidatus Lokiarchaeota archaeon]|nr:hypothetical protein [Candidatus Lokiarchaeota archaeon]
MRRVHIISALCTVLIITGTSYIPIHFELKQWPTTSDFELAQDEDSYMSLSKEHLVILSSSVRELGITLTNIDNAPHNLSVNLATANQQLGFIFNGEEIEPVDESDDILVYRIPHICTNAIPNRTTSLSVDVLGELQRGVVYTLSKFTIQLERDDIVIEEKNVDAFITQGFEKISRYELNSTGEFAPDALYNFSNNPLLASTSGRLKIEVNNSDEILHSYEIVINDKARQLRVFKGEEEVIPLQQEEGNVFRIHLGNIQVRDVIPLTLSASQLRGITWSRYMIELSLVVDNSTMHQSSAIGVDVGNAAPEDIIIEELTLERLDDDSIKATLRLNEEGRGFGLFGITFEGSQALAVLGWAGPRIASVLLTRGVFPRLFESSTAASIEAGIAGFLISTGIGLIIEAVIVSPDNPILGLVLAIAGAALIMVGIVCIFFKNQNKQDIEIPY